MLLVSVARGSHLLASSDGELDGKSNIKRKQSSRSQTSLLRFRHAFQIILPSTDVQFVVVQASRPLRSRPVRSLYRFIVCRDNLLDMGKEDFRAFMSVTMYFSRVLPPPPRHFCRPACIMCTLNAAAASRRLSTRHSLTPSCPPR